MKKRGRRSEGGEAREEKRGRRIGGGEAREEKEMKEPRVERRG